MELKIMKADDSQEYFTAEVHVPYNDTEGFRTRTNNTVYPSSFRGNHEPTIAAIKVWVTSVLGLQRKGRGNFNQFIIFGDKGLGLKAVVSKIGTRYHLMGEMASKDTIITAIARTIYKSCFTNDNDSLYSYMLHHLRLPANVSYALENRAPYHWYKKGKKIEVRFNVEMVGQDVCALEISDGHWAQITVKQLNVYMGYYWLGKHKGSWKYLSPKKLWTRLMKKEPTEGQLKMMLAFLEQNRTDDLVQKRAYQLVSSLEEQYPKRIKVVWEQDKKGIKAMAVRGKLADWVITDNQFKSDIQAVSTYIYHHSEGDNVRVPMQMGELSGPICIDNMTKNSSIGDQFAARALALLNDTFTIKIVNTINRYLRPEHYDGQTECRLSLVEFAKNYGGLPNE